MMDRLRWWSRDPLVLLAIVAGLIAFVVQSGDLDSADTTRRLQTTHSFWTSAPPVLPDDYPEFGLHGRGGRIYAWYGIGQSLLMLPADMVGAFLEQLPVFADYNGADPSIRNIAVSYSTNILVNVLTALVCLRFLLLLGFELNHAIAGVLALLVCTTHLHYTQNMMENNYIMLLTLGGFAYQYEWLLTGNRRSLLIGSAAFGLNLLTRLTTGLDLLTGSFFLLLALWFLNVRRRDLWNKFVAYARITIPIYGVFFLLDRLYQFYRFGSFFNTYVAVFAQEQHRLKPDLPANFPFETPFHVGFFGALFTPEKSIFLLDPLLLLTILVSLFAWKRFGAEIRAYLVSSWILLLAYICFYARYTVWSGDSAWGDRYVSTAAEMVAFISVPLLLKYRAEVPVLACKVGVAILAIAAVVQMASVAFWLELELTQMLTLGHPTFVVGLRFKNIVAFALGKAEEWGLMNPGMTDDAWDYVHITTWNFFPFVLQRVGEAPAWVVRIAFVVWGAGVGLLAVAWWRLAQALKISAGASRVPAGRIFPSTHPRP
jgi:hypothetical protein